MPDHQGASTGPGTAAVDARSRGASGGPAKGGVHVAGPVEGRHVVPLVTGATDVRRIPAVARAGAVPGRFPIEDPDRAGIARGVLDVAELGRLSRPGR